MNVPSLEYVGEYAFYGMVFLKSIDLSKVTFVGEAAFVFCEALETVTLTDTLTEIPAYTFYSCKALANIDLSNLVKVGEGAFYYVALPAHLSLDNVEVVASFAFVEAEDEDPTTNKEHTLESVYAPKLTHVGDQAFAGCINLASVYAPNMQSIGYGAFAYTSIEKLEITNALSQVNLNIFEGSEKFKGLYVLVGEEEVYTIELDNVLLDGGALYSKTDKGYILTTYPTAKADEEYEVLEGTFRVEFGAALGNKNLQKVTLPTTLKYIGNYAFYGCESLTTVVFKSYYAPVLEGTMTGEQVKIDFTTHEDYTGFDILYGYDYYYLTQSEVAAPYYYQTFINIVGHKDTKNLVAILPDSNNGYDSLIYKAFFKVDRETSGTNSGKYAVDFINAVSKLPENIDRFDKNLINAAINAYNALLGHPEETQFVDDSVFTFFENARKAYNVDVVMDKIDHLFDMDKLEYCFNNVKDAKLAYDALTAEEKALVTNASVLEEKIADLNELYGKTINFNLSYSDYVETPVNPNAPGSDVNDNNTTTETTEESGVKAWVVVVIVISSVLALGGATVLTVILIKKKRTAV